MTEASNQSEFPRLTNFPYIPKPTPTAKSDSKYDLSQASIKAGSDLLFV
jgi:hypothetical protein